MDYGLHFHELESNESEIIFWMIKLSFEQYLKHRIYTNGFEEKNRQKKTEYECSSEL
jgi:ribonuclease Z